jgi:hypothetical protein
MRLDRYTERRKNAFAALAIKITKLTRAFREYGPRPPDCRLMETLTLLTNEPNADRRRNVKLCGRHFVEARCQPPKFAEHIGLSTG